MKKLIFLCLLLLPAFRAAAQGEDLLPPPLEYQVTQETRINGQLVAEPPSYYESMDTLYKLLSPERMQTSFLIDRAMPRATHASHQLIDSAPAA